MSYDYKKYNCMFISLDPPSATSLVSAMQQSSPLVLSTTPTAAQSTLLLTPSLTPSPTPTQEVPCENLLIVHSHCSLCVLFYRLCV